MTDIHSHLVSDRHGEPITTEDAIKMIYEAEEAGIDSIYATPRYNCANTDLTRAQEDFRVLSGRAAGIGVTLALGYEVEAEPAILERPEDLQRLTLGGSAHMLVVFQPDVLPVFVQSFTDSLQERGILPILAHPERNTWFLRNPGLLSGISRRGCLVQVDAASITGLHGDRVRNLARNLIASDVADFVSSNARSVSGYADWFPKAYRTVCCWVGEKKAGRLFCSAAGIISDTILNTGVTAGD